METYYLNLIAKSYIKLTIENNDNLAFFFFQKYNKLKNGTQKNRFFNKLIENIENLINNSYTKAKAPDLSGIPDEHLDDYRRELKRKKNNFLYEMDLYYLDCDIQGIPYYIPNWEICTDATKLTDALINDYVELKDPIAIITPSKKISKKELIVRKSKLEYLISEAERARIVTSIDELDETFDVLTPSTDFPKKDNYNKIEMAINKDIDRALEIIKPIGGVYKHKLILEVSDMLRLNDYIKSIIVNGLLPNITSPFPKTNIPNQFIRKTIHNVYLAIGKKNKDEFIEIIHLFKQFEETELTTTNSKFSIYEGNYDDKLMEILY